LNGLFLRDLTKSYKTSKSSFMKSILSLLPVFALLFSCDLLDNSKVSSTSIGGDGNLEMNKAGTTFYSYVKIGSTNYNANSTISVLSNDNGVVTVQVKATLPANIAALIPAAYKDAAGKLNTTLKYKNTSEGILDYTVKDSQPFVLVNYSSSVGDQYILQKNDGTTITRTVTAKSTADDFPYGIMNIKTMTVEQSSNVPGLRKVIYKANHKYSLVQIQLLWDDGTTTTIDFI
jgi:hypothetical protein